jgi:hypothetical protein
MPVAIVAAVMMLYLRINLRSYLNKAYNALLSGGYVNTAVPQEEYYICGDQNRADATNRSVEGD